MILNHLNIGHNFLQTFHFSIYFMPHQFLDCISGTLKGKYAILPMNCCNRNIWHDYVSKVLKYE